MPTGKKRIEDPIDQVSAELNNARQLGKQIARSVPQSDLAQLTLVEEHLAAIVQKWLQQYRHQDVSDISVRDFSVLMKFLLDVSNRREAEGQVKDQSSTPLQDEQLAAIQQTLIGLES